MTTVGEGADAASKVIGILKDLPFWLLAGLAVTADVLLFVPAIAGELSESYRPWLIVAAVLANVLAVFRLLAIAQDKLRERRASRAKRRTFHISPDAMQAHWSTHRQADDSTTTQITVRGMVKNLTDAPLGLVTPRLIKPRIKGEILYADVMVPLAGRNVYGTATHSGHRVLPKAIAPVTLHIMIRGIPRHPSTESLPVVLGITDDEGNEQRIKAILRGMAPSKLVETVAPLERVFSIANPIEKEIVSVLQSEMSRYDKNGRERGGFGSIHVVYQGRMLTGFGQDSWNSDSPKNQSIVENPDTAEVHSDHLAALLTFYQRLSTEAEKEQFASALLDRLDANKGYLRVSYFIVCVLWKIGRLSDALKKASLFAENEIKLFGLSNILYMLNGLLRYRHTDFTPEMLDQIERFVHDLKKEHVFHIPEKVAAIRAMRLLAEPTEGSKESKLP